MDTLILGAGTMGRWVGGLDIGQCTFVDRDPETAAAAADIVAGARSAASLSGGYDLVCVTVPMSAARTAIERVSSVDPAAVVDVTGAMAGPLKALADYHPNAQRASFHPLFAPANGPGNVAAVVDAGGSYVEQFVAAMEAAGNTVFETTATEHDRAMETIQAAAHTAVLAYGLAAESVPEAYETPVSRTLETLRQQVTGGDPDIYAEIQAQFAGADRVADAASELAAADPAEFQSLYRAARNTDTQQNG